MKKTLLLLIAAICCLTGYADVPKRKMLEQGKMWIYIYHHYDYESDATIENVDEYLDHEMWMSYYQLDGETEIDGRQYMKMYRWDDQNGEKSYYGAFREDEEGRVYMYGYQGEKKECLILDFSLQYDYNSFPNVVPIAETIKSNGQLFRRYRYQNTPPDGSTYELGFIGVEGVGFQGAGLVHPILEDKPHCICDYEELAYVHGKGFYFTASAFSAPKEIELTEGERQLVAQNNDFAFRLFRKVRTGENKVLSPLSITYALGMLNNGAAGQTQEEIYNVLGFDNVDVQNAFCQKMMNELEAAGQMDNTTKALISNTIFVNQGRGFELQPDFTLAANQYYYAYPSARNFFDGETCKAINQWASDHTEGVIKEVLKEDEFDPYAVSYLLNALYFKGMWSTPFDAEETKEESFADGSIVPMMHNYIEDIMYAKNDLCQSVVLPYGNGTYQLHVFLPHEGKTLDELLENLNATNWQMRGSEYAVDIKLPRFETETEQKLEQVMSELGMPSAFNLEKADFSRLCIGGSNIYIAFMKQVAKIKLDENGTEAAAATIIGMEETGIPDEVAFYAKRPFLYIISEQSTGAIFFIGQYMGNVTTSDTNAINEIENEKRGNGENEKAIYDLSGRKVSGDRNSNFKINNPKLQKGIYIQGGKKVVVK